MGRNNADFHNGKLQGPSQHMVVTPSEKDTEKTGILSYGLELPVGETKKDAGKRIAHAMRSGGGMPKPKKVEFNKDEGLS
jgi:hypothetical protein